MLVYGWDSLLYRVQYSTVQKRKEMSCNSGQCWSYSGHGGSSALSGDAENARAGLHSGILLQLTSNIFIYFTLLVKSSDFFVFCFVQAWSALCQGVQGRCSKLQVLIDLTHGNENPISVFPEKELRGLNPNFHMCLWAMYIFQGSAHIFSCNRIGRPIVGMYKSLTDTWMRKLRLRPRNSFTGNNCFKFSLLCLCSAVAYTYSKIKIIG